MNSRKSVNISDLEHTQASLSWEFSEPARKDLSLVMPFFNEEESVVKTITELVQSLRLGDFSFEIVAVDNGSSDDTTSLLLHLQDIFPEVRDVRVFPNQGYGWGILNGLSNCQGEHVGYMAGDGQVASKDVLETYQLFRHSNCDLAKVRRTTRGDGPVRATVSIIYNTLFSLLTGFRESDTNASPKFFRRSELPGLDLNSKDWFLDAEVMMKAHMRSWHIEELEVDFLPREGGHSYVRLQTLWEFTRNLVVAAVKMRLAERDRNAVSGTLRS